MAVELQKQKFTSKAYHQMAEIGIFSADEKIELLNGEIIKMSPVGSKHNGIVFWLNQFLSINLKLDAIISVQASISLGEYSEPEPDIAICYPEANYYRERLAQAQDVILVVEVSDTTLAKDREVKLPLYAEAGIQTYWIINIRDRQVEVYTNPEGKTYSKKVIYSENDVLTVPEFSLEISVKEMLG